MRVFEQTRLWKTTLAPQGDNDPAAALRDRFRHSLIQIRERAETLADEIPRDIRDLTVHDVPRHIDALWQIADLIVGETYSLTPTEAYVLGGSFLLHDLGLALASYPHGVDDLRRDPIWRDLAAQVLRKVTGHPPSQEEILNLDAATTQTVLESVLRLKHAEAAQTLALIKYQYNPESPEYYLIEDVDFRNTYGKLIGAIAYSHWWPIEQLTKSFSERIGSFPGAPPDWVIDPLKLACILRAADACHIDGRRAPGFLRALRKPTGEADRHWRFQDYVQTPRVDNQRIVFSVSKGIPLEDADAWWVGYELIALADQEVHDVDMVLRDSDRLPFAVFGVAGANDPSRLKRYIPTAGWEPVSTEIRVSNVASLVRKLGGASLYGENPKVPLRELIQNARDAIVARRIAEQRDRLWGCITVRLFAEGETECVEVRDNGLGMSQELLCGPFLDFGTSYWHAPLMIKEHPGLAASEFEPQGRFGIGFFSVFMWGERVSVVTRSIHDSVDNTRVLEFESGLSQRPVLRVARRDERLAEPGTRVRIWLAKPATECGGFLAPTTYNTAKYVSTEKKKWTLAQVVAWLCPVIDVSINTDERGVVSQSVTANDWQTMEACDLVYRLIQHRCKDESVLAEPWFRLIVENILPVATKEGEMLGRAALIPGLIGSEHVPANSPFPLLATTAGYFRGWEMDNNHIAGVLIGRPTSASRVPSRAIAYDRLDALGVWATEQANLVPRVTSQRYRIAHCALAIRRYGGHTGPLPIGRDYRGIITFDSLAARRDLPNEVELHDDEWAFDYGMKRTLAQCQIGVATGSMKTLHDTEDESDPLNRADHPLWDTYWMSLWAAAIEAIAIAWNVPLKDVLDASDIHGGHVSETGQDGGIAMRLVPDVIRNPRA